MLLTSSVFHVMLKLRKAMSFLPMASLTFSLQVFLSVMS